MMVHRVENTLLLDDFDVYDYLMKSEWSWLKDFFYENIVKTMSEQVHNICHLVYVLLKYCFHLRFVEMSFSFMFC